MYKILIVDDDQDIGNIIESALKAEGYETRRAYSGTEALLVLDNYRPDIITLDLMLPGLSGEELLPKITGIPVIVVSAKIDIDNKVELLMKGAADYITKPFELRELVARIKVQLRKLENTQTTSLTTYGDISIDALAQTVSIKGEELKLTRTEYAILKLLMQNPKQVIAKSVLLDRISVDTPDCTERSLKQHISNLRKKILDASGKDYVETVWGIGFKLANLD